jgi:small conductance mechanosensitive channel
MEQVLKELQTLTVQIRLFAPKAGVALLIFLSFWLVSIVLKALVRIVGDKFVPSKKEAITLLAQSIKGILIALGAVMALGKMGINITALVAGLGLTGFALGFALRDILSNLLAGALILVYRPFEQNDRIVVAGFEGIVTHIDLRYTTLEAEGKKILIPNSTLFTNAISVFKVKE